MKPIECRECGWLPVVTTEDGLLFVVCDCDDLAPFDISRVPRSEWPDRWGKFVGWHNEHRPIEGYEGVTT